VAGADPKMSYPRLMVVLPRQRWEALTFTGSEKLDATATRNADTHKIWQSLSSGYKLVAERQSVPKYPNHSLMLSQEEVMNTTTSTVVSIHHNIAELISVLSEWRVKVAHDDAGLYISMTNPENDNDHRGLSLSNDENEDDLSGYRWQFWNEAHGVWLDSTLGAEDGAEEILGFLKDCLLEESLPIVVSE
jgi:hypothetical protein